MASSEFKHGHYSFIIHFRHGKSIPIEGTINAGDRSKQYITDFSVRRNISSGGSLTFTIRDLSRSDSLYLYMKNLFIMGERQLFQDGVDVTWKQILETGNVVKLTINGEYRGTFMISSISRVTNERVTGYSVSCIGLQEWLSRQSVHWDVGAEALYLKKNKLKESQYLKNWSKYVPSSDLPETTSPAGGIKFIINKMLNGFIDSVYGSYRFNDGKTIQDMIGLALSPVSYFGMNTQIIQRMGSVMTESGFSIWDAIIKFQAPPFHEIWVTTGQRLISLYDMKFQSGGVAGKAIGSSVGGRANLENDKEYIIFRPTPYDHPFINDAQVDQIPGKNGQPRVITTKMLNDYSLHTVEATMANFGIGPDQIITQRLHNSDDNLYSTYKVQSFLMRLSGGTADTLFPPIVDLEAMRQVGRRVYTASLEGKDVSKDIKKISPESHTTTVEYFRILQAKAYNWFKYNGRFNKGQIVIAWMPGIYEGMHVPVTSLYPDEDGVYYINGYELTVTHNDMTYNLDVTRGFPFTGFKRNATDYSNPKESEISNPTPKTTTGETNVPPVEGTPRKDTIKTGKTGNKGGGSGGSKSGRSRNGGSSFIEVFNNRTKQRIILKVNDTNGDVYDASTNKKLGNLATFDPSPYIGNATRMETSTPVGAQTERWNTLRMKFGYKPRR